MAQDPYLAFLLGGQLYGLPLDRLREVARLTRVRRVPGAPAGVAGLVNLRGEIVCALDIRAILGLPPAAADATAFLVALRGFDDPVGIIVDSISNIYTVDSEAIEPPPDGWAPRPGCVRGAAPVAEGLMALLDVDGVVNIDLTGTL
jgi:purine-binding chemotaxis protein CheW